MASVTTGVSAENDVDNVDRVEVNTPVPTKAVSDVVEGGLSTDAPHLMAGLEGKLHPP